MKRAEELGAFAPGKRIGTHTLRHSYARHLLMARPPNRYSRRQLRTLQRRVRQWRIVVAKQLVYASAEQNEMNEATGRQKWLTRYILLHFGVGQSECSLRRRVGYS